MKNCTKKVMENIKGNWLPATMNVNIPYANGYYIHTKEVFSEPSDIYYWLRKHPFIAKRVSVTLYCGGEILHVMDSNEILDRK